MIEIEKSENFKGLIKGKCCAVCKHCYYTGLPGAVACEITEKFTDHFGSCEKFELSYVYWEMNAE